ncbi:hypothetical protein J8L86_20025 [Shewanella sp. MMG014]|uniref:hypothetical protein n=1 Tax=Shewanella sp. MMG014 TaxID=2822691 RepID=UPI001B396A5D|nr:hypothetical protein [Shewanella sp. MMG014]MBQ4892145.1 hypothetical protein [Shewanella sp. MMG014]
MNLIKILKWSSITFLILVALLYLNSSIYSFWVSSFPEKNTLGWAERGIRHFIWAISALIVAFILIKKLQLKVKRYLIAIAVILLLAPELHEFMYSDQCLDSGGSWDYSKYLCEK